MELRDFELIFFSSNGPFQMVEEENLIKKGILKI